MRHVHAVARRDRRDEERIGAPDEPLVPGRQGLRRSVKPGFVRRLAVSYEVGIPPLDVFGAVRVDLRHPNQQPVGRSRLDSPVHPHALSGSEVDDQHPDLGPLRQRRADRIGLSVPRADPHRVIVHGRGESGRPVERGGPHTPFSVDRTQEEEPCALQERLRGAGNVVTNSPPHPAGLSGDAGAGLDGLLPIVKTSGWCGVRSHEATNGGLPTAAHARATWTPAAYAWSAHARGISGSRLVFRSPTGGGTLRRTRTSALCPTAPARHPYP